MVPDPLAGLVGGAIDAEHVRAHWGELLRLAVSVRSGHASASGMLRRLAAYPRQNGLAVALREVGRIERTLFTLDWLKDPDLRRRANAGLNKGEARNALARAVFFHRLGELRDRSFENQAYRASGLNLLVAAIILWNTRYLQAALEALASRGAGTGAAEVIRQGWVARLRFRSASWRSASALRRAVPRAGRCRGRFPTAASPSSGCPACRHSPSRRPAARPPHP